MIVKLHRYLSRYRPRVKLGDLIGHYSKALITSVTAVLVSACQIQPVNPENFVEIVTPEITGKLIQAGEPLANVAVSLARNEGVLGVCERSIKTVQTDADGRFVIAEVVREGQPSLSNSLENDWQVCVNYEGESLQIWHDSHIGAMWGAKKTVLNCDMKRVLARKRPACR